MNLNHIWGAHYPCQDVLAGVKSMVFVDSQGFHGGEAGGTDV